MEYRSEQQRDQVEWLLKGRDFSNLREMIRADVIDSDGTALVVLEYKLGGIGKGEGLVYHYFDTLAVKADGAMLQIQTNHVTLYPDNSEPTHHDTYQTPSGVWDE